MTQIARVVIYYVDGTYQEVVQGNLNISVPPNMPSITDYISDYKLPGEAGKWDYPPFDIGTRIVD